MLYLSQILGRKVYFDGKIYGKLLDMAIFENRPSPPVSKIEIQHKKQKVTISPHALVFQGGKILLTSSHIPQLPYDHKDFYLVEDLLDKQVIDTDGKRLVRVNDVLIDETGGLNVSGIDVGFDGVLRRLGLPFLSVDKKILPWTAVEALDYETGNVRLNVKQRALSSLHPAEVADILEDAGTKERLGIVTSMDVRQAARAIAEANDETQVSILEGLTPSTFKEIINRMHASQLADVFRDLNPERARELKQILGEERYGQVRKLSTFRDDVAGGLMRENFFSSDCDKTIHDVQQLFKDVQNIPETIVITNGQKKLLGTVQTKNLYKYDEFILLRNMNIDKKNVHTNTSLQEIIRLFAEYNLRSLPVIDKEKKPIGLIVIDDLLAIIQEESEKNDNI